MKTEQFNLHKSVPYNEHVAGASRRPVRRSLGGGGWRWRPPCHGFRWRGSRQVAVCQDSAVAQFFSLAAYASMKSSGNNLALDNIVGGAFIGISAVIAIAGLIWLGKTAVFVSRASKASGTVTEATTKIRSRGEYRELSMNNLLHGPVYTFADSSGVIHTQRLSFSSSTSMDTFEPGEKISVLYERAAPNNSKIDTFGQLWLGSLLTIFGGMLSGGFAYCWLCSVTRETRAKNMNDAA
jgi:hypothetical protein